MVTVPNSKRLTINRPGKTIELNGEKLNTVTFRKVDPNWKRKSDALFREVDKSKQRLEYYIEQVDKAEQKHNASIDSVKKQKTKQDLDYCFEKFKLANNDLLKTVNHFADHHKVKL